MHPIIDNYATHNHRKLRARLERHRRFHFRFTPTLASWLNAVEQFFAEPTRHDPDTIIEKVRRGNRALGTSGVAR